MTRWSLPLEPGSAAVARTLVSSETKDLGSDVERTAVLLTDELIANAVRYGGGSLEVALCVNDHRLVVRVSDDAPAGSMGADEPDPRRTSGRGLYLVDTLASRWGVAPRAVGKDVWFELDLSGRRVPDAPAT